MTKSEIIENLYKSGKISFEEAMTLSNSSSEESGQISKSTLYDTDQQNIKEQTINEFVKQIVDEYYDEEVSDENLAFDSAKCVAAMEANDWSWFDTGIPTEDEFKDHLRDLVKQVIESVINKYRKNENAENDYYAGIETGGIHVDGWITIDEKGKKTLEIRPMFILEQSEYFLDEEKLNNLL